MFKSITSAFSKLYQSVTSLLPESFTGNMQDPETVAQLEKILLSADMGTTTTKTIIEKLKKSPNADTRAALGEILTSTIANKIYHAPETILMLVGLNGSGKTTSAAKLAALYQSQGKKVLLVAADTFRAAAVEQLEQWAGRLNIKLIKGAPNQDPASVVYQACTEFKTGSYDTMIIDTAGRLQTKINLMKELEKIRRTITKQLPEAPVTTLLTVDSMLGQNSFEQARLFHEATPLDGVILTKFDGTGKGGIVFAITEQLSIPVAYITFGEQPENISKFDSQEFINRLVQP